MAVDIRDPIKEIKWMRLGDLIHNSRNWKTHPQAQKDALRGAIEELGFGDVVKAYFSGRQGGLTLLDAHARQRDSSGPASARCYYGLR